jgi:hypothetical protein
LKTILNKLIEQNFIKSKFNIDCNNNELTIDNLIIHFSTTQTINHIIKKHSLNILCCLMCENDFSLLNIALAPFFNQKFFHSKTTSSNSIFIETFNEASKQLVSCWYVGNVKITLFLFC